MKKILALLVILGTTTCHVMAQEINVESLLKKADDAAKLADKFPKDGLKQVYAAEALTNFALNEKRDFDRAQTYVSRALDIAKKQKVLKDTLLAKAYFLMANTNMVQGSYAIACDYYEMAIDASEKELGRYSPYTIFTRMQAGRSIMMVDPDLRHGFIHLMKAFYDNESAPGGKPIPDMERLNSYFSLGMEQMIAAFTNSQRFGVPVILKDQKPCFLIQSRDWHIGQPLINWLAPNMLRSQQEREAHAGEDIILLEDENFRALTKEEGKNVRFDFPACSLKGHELSIDPGSFIWYLNPEAYNKIVQDYEAFKKNGKK
jgi:tetratricopeptide (TPR) repeat protein